jgi:hypothetical protein
MATETKTDEWEEHRRQQKERRRIRLARRTNEIKELTRAGFDIREITPYQFRIDGRLDIFPVHNRFHDIKTDERGGFKNIKTFVFDHLKKKEGSAPDWESSCSGCGAIPIVPESGLCGPCTFGEAETIGGNW